MCKWRNAAAVYQFNKKTAIQWLMTSNSIWLSHPRYPNNISVICIIPEARLVLLKKVGLFSVFEGTRHSTVYIHRAKPSSSPKQLHSRVPTSKLLTGNNLILSHKLCTGISWERAVLLRPYLWQELFNTIPVAGTPWAVEDWYTIMSPHHSLFADTCVAREAGALLWT